MGRPGAYLELDRVEHGVQPAAEAVKSYDDIVVPLSEDAQRQQASRCMYCGVAFCQVGAKIGGNRHATGCPLHNLIPETNDLVWQGRWADAAARLSLTNPFPEFTGRVCPAPCEVACNLGLHDAPVTIHDDERAISDWAFEEAAHTDETADAVKPAIARALPAVPEDAPLVAVVGSGPAGLAVAWELTRLGARVRVIERADRPGGLLEYGIPNMKLPKDVVERRINLMKESGIQFDCGVDASDPAVVADLAKSCDAIVVAAGATAARAVNVPGAAAQGVHFAVEYLTEATRALLDGRDPEISAQGKDVVVVGGGDTGVDCVATALRQGAKSVRQVIRAACPPMVVNKLAVWPNSPGVFETAYGQEEAKAVEGEDPRVWSTDTIGFTVEDGAVSAAQLKDISYEGGRHDVDGTEREIPAQLVLIAKGFVGVETPLADAFGLPLQERRPLPQMGEGHKAAGSSVDVPVYVAGDARTGATLVVSAISDGLACAREVAKDLL